VTPPRERLCRDRARSGRNSELDCLRQALNVQPLLQPTCDSRLEWLFRDLARSGRNLVELSATSSRCIPIPHCHPNDLQCLSSSRRPSVNRLWERSRSDKKKSGIGANRPVDASRASPDRGHRSLSEDCYFVPAILLGQCTIHGPAMDHNVN